MIKQLVFLTTLFLAPVLMQAQSLPEKTFTLNSGIAYAFENNSFLKAIWKNADIADKEIAISKSAFLPVVELAGNTQYTDMYNDLDEYSSSSLAIDAAQPIWQNGKIRLQSNIAEANKEIAGLQYQIGKQDLIFSISGQYLTVLRYTKLEELSAEMVRRMAINAESATERMKLGVAKKSDVLRAETRLSDARILEKRYKTLKQTSLESLKQLIGYDSTGTIIFKGEIASINESYLNISVDSFLTIAAQTLPELQLENYRQQSQQYAIKLEQRTNLPDLWINAGYNINDNLLINNNQYGYAGVSMRFTMFNGFEKKNRIAREKIRFEQLTNEYTDLQLAINTEIRQAYLSLNEAKLQINNSLTQLESAAENQEMVTEEYKMGTSSMLELLEAETDYFRAQQNNINALWAYRRAEITLERKSGIFKY